MVMTTQTLIKHKVNNNGDNESRRVIKVEMSDDKMCGGTRVFLVCFCNVRYCCE